MTLLIPLGLVVLLEASLHLCGVGYDTQFFLNTPSGEAFVPNDHFAWQFFSRKTGARPDYFILPARKDPSSVRIFVLGESAVMGAPAPSFGFSRILEVMLNRRYPDKKCEIYNVAMHGINSHIIRPIALECLEHQADLLIIYMGNNEASSLSNHGVPGARLFEDHVHLTFDGNHLLAQLVYPVVTRSLADRLGHISSKGQSLPSAAECDEALAFTLWDHFKVESAIVQQMSMPPFTGLLDHSRHQAAREAALQARRAVLTPQDLHQCLKGYETALQARPQDWKLRYNLGLFYQEMNQPAAAMRELEPVVQAFPQIAPFRLPLAAALAAIGQRETALSHLQEAARLEPELRGLQQMRLQLQNGSRK